MSPSSVELDRLDRQILAAVDRFHRPRVRRLLRELRRTYVPCSATARMWETMLAEIRAGADPFAICEFALQIPPGHRLRDLVKEAFAPMHRQHNRAWKLHRIRPCAPRTPRTIRSTRSTRTTTARRSASGPRRASASSASGDDPGEPGEPDPPAHRQRPEVEHHTSRTAAPIGGVR